MEKISLNEVLAENILIRSQRLGLNLTGLIKKSGLSRNSLSYIRNGHARKIAFLTLEKIAQALECEPYELLKPVDF
ncbi:helix-turn-helix domain-containing protein [Lentilactobacillus hilgardii]|uniref:DNA-binding helix-turn-helix protein n=1 Tax=Lentilactobacillus hilgardii (strain ATCC 8290 / DSM 20176 / CCUG 30140 / JCM 1155 / KCTC 3500 / NBRC 15886 / NCIMB 8040 / NRRL B-1843 / 9) TaxID=1423757 RepID=C0XGP7_LENH9|nr:helix-turn-helix domain-containing protein [Lentilactobacillus hilgardii]EEI25459.1 DNA-binding helix-turn-helix protein [Lentilactobacillus hilgardii DSM 20176 = ATCC 8290]KRK56823.1 hypothetical protein FD42_GL002556 [Lentilactobacillus hilgardii DSM 20176 = ATCC 8290]QEU39814.1 helix-turn-helix domain-containing protein [Lentilactobacillus hilgardii]TDG85367.1 hypothetical protein C5L34_002625 [Lentilactobacillus hilgardii]